MYMARLLCAFVILLVVLVSVCSFAEESPSQTSAGQTTETQAPASAPSAQEYKFEPSEIEKKPYHIGGYFEFRPILYVLDKDAALYKLNFGKQNLGRTTEDYDSRLWLEGSYEKGIFGAFLKTNLELNNTYQGWDYGTQIFEGYGSLKPSSSLTIDLGKRVFNWGKGYAWSPVAFVDRPKDSNDPQLPREGYVAATADYIRSFKGPLKTFSLSPILLPVYQSVNADFGTTGYLNFAAKLYFLFYDTDIDFLFLTGKSKTNRVGFDFSRNLTTNLEVHGEFAFIKNQQTTSVDSVGNVSVATYDATSFLLGLRYLSSMDTTYIFEYYHNGTGYSSSQLTSFYSFTDNAFDIYESTGNKKQFLKAETLFQGNYGKMNPGKDYLYLRISQDQPFNILYLTPALTTIMNVDDRSFSISPELLYTGIKNWEFRLKGSALVGSHGTEFGEKQNDYMVEFRVRYYFSLP
jgi:hypothetical protein